jgi:hypothetical protein
MSPVAYARLIKLLPKLSAVTDEHRLEVLSDIDRVLAAEGLMWADIVEALIPPEETIPADDLLAMLDTIERERMFLTARADMFLVDLRTRAADNDIVHLTGKQSAWLHLLLQKAEHQRSERERIATNLQQIDPSETRH